MPRLGDELMQRRAAQAALRRWVNGELSDRELSSWAHAHIGHEGAKELQDLVVADDLLDELEYTDATEASVRDDLDRIATAILSLPDPWA